MRSRILLVIALLMVAVAAPMIAALIPPFFLDCVVAIGYRPLMAVIGPDGKTLIAQRGPFIPVASGFLYGHFLKKVSDTENEIRTYLVTNDHVLADVERVEKQQIDEVSKLVSARESPTMFLRFNPKATGRAQDFSVPIHNPNPVQNWVRDKLLEHIEIVGFSRKSRNL
jgi:hypothetical protein